MSRPLHVLLDLSLLSRTETHRGVIRYSTELARALHARAAAGQELLVSAVMDVPWFGAPRVSRDIPEVLAELELHRRRSRKSDLARGPVAEALGRTRHALSRAATESRASVVHSLDPETSPRSSLGIPRVVTCHHVDSTVLRQDWHGSEGRVRLDGRRFLRADRVIAISRATAQELIASLDVPRSKIDIVYNGVDLRVWRDGALPDDSARLSALGLRGQPYLLCVGAVDRRKNVDGVLSGLSRARELSARSDLVVAWVGKLSRSEEALLESRARRFGVEDRVVRLGYVADEDLAALYRGATALVFASLREGFGYPVVEAMASGCPVVTSNCSSLIEVAEHAAVTVDPTDTSAIADAIVLLADDNAERRRLGREGVLRAAEFSIDRMVDGTLRAYESARLDRESPGRDGSRSL